MFLDPGTPLPHLRVGRGENWLHNDLPYLQLTATFWGPAPHHRGDASRRLFVFYERSYLDSKVSFANWFNLVSIADSNDSVTGAAFDGNASGLEWMEVVRRRGLINCCVDILCDDDKLY